MQSKTDIPNTYNVDNSKQLLSDTDNISKIYTTKTASYYGAVKVDYENQYGQYLIKRANQPRRVI